MLTALVTTKYVLSLYSFDSSDGSFKNGISFDYGPIVAAVHKMKSTPVNNQLLASNSFNNITTDATAMNPATQSAGSQEGTDYNTGLSATGNSSSSTDIAAREEVYDNPISMESGHTLVVYDISNPDNSLVASTFYDIEDDAPLDNGNTVISGMMLLMPRR